MTVKEVTEYFNVMQAERSIHFYGGDNCDEKQPYWETSCEGEMDSEDVYEPLMLDASTFPPGTRIFIQQPCCPDCEQPRELCDSDEYCKFNWDEWDGKYS